MVLVTGKRLNTRQALARVRMARPYPLTASGEIETCPCHFSPSFEPYSLVSLWARLQEREGREENGFAAWFWQSQDEPNVERDGEGRVPGRGQGGHPSCTASCVPSELPLSHAQGHPQPTTIRPARLGCLICLWSSPFHPTLF